MREEEEIVEIDDDTEIRGAVVDEAKRQAESKDEDILWAEDDPDDDDPKWKMKLLVVDENDV